MSSALVTIDRRYADQATMGRMTLPSGEVIASLELPWRQNQPNVSCIPPGVYVARWLPRSGSGKYRRVWHVQDVPGRSGILIHGGNLPEHTWGCILPGMREGAAVVPSVSQSQSALNLMREEMEGRDFLLRLV